ncbi:unnamed protein product [Brassicogethes aeneus]|uniref:Uncharacterized protein n=1 Tax=Brassicogethes aeneus TaxID=1431903 RepID=A0A9P0AW18_BRAAE|nr:unnamed protein product [Brassicogethes aeneus]
MHKSCWTIESAALLTTRMILEDLMPTVEDITIDGNDFISDLMTYYREIISVVREQTRGKRKHIVLLALTDIIGGYLKMVVIPRAKKAYYAGVIDFSSMERLLQLYEELKWFLRTNGLGWGKTNDYNIAVKILPLNMDTVQCKESCDAIIYYTKSQVIPQTPATSQKNKNATETDKKEQKDVEPNYIFPIPFFDTKIHPNAIAIPFKHKTLRNIESKKANNLIMNFFKAVYTCMDDKKVDMYSRKKFYNEFYSWINRDCIPKTEDDKFYAAFGGILRVEDALRSFGAELLKITTTTTIKFDEEGLNEVASQEAGNSSFSSSNSSLVILAILIAIFVWFLLGVLFICYRIRSKRKYQCTCTSKSTIKKNSSKLNKGSTSSKTSSTDSRTYAKCTCETKSSSPETQASKTSTKSSKDKTSNSKLDEHTKSPLAVATLETMQSLKLLPSIAEISERSTSKDDKNLYDSEETSNSSSFSLESNEDRKERDHNAKSYSIYHHEEYLKRKGALQRKLKACDSKRYSQSSSTKPQEYSSSTQRDSYGTEPSTSEENATKSNRSTETSSGQLSKDKNAKETSDFSTDATSQLLKGSPTRKKKTTDETSSGSSEVNPSELRRIISANTSRHKDIAQDIKIPPHTTQCHTDLSVVASSEGKKKYSFGYDFHTTSSGESSIESEDSASEIASEIASLSR